MYVEGRQLPQVLEKIYDVKCYINKQIFVYKSMRYKDILISQYVNRTIMSLKKNLPSNLIDNYDKILRKSIFKLERIFLHQLC